MGFKTTRALRALGVFAAQLHLPLPVSLLTTAVTIVILALLNLPAHAGPMDTGGQLAVSESGAANYTIPIQVPPGTAGMEPKLALSYSSQSGNGLLGVGWSLSGLSAITRCPRTMAQDSFRGSVNFGANDRFCLDGQRLILVTEGGNPPTGSGCGSMNGTYGANCADYRTERDTFSRIVSFGSTTGDPSYFKVWTKAGQIIEYGNTTDSRIEAQGKTQVRAWAINMISDTKKNCLAFTYTEDPANGDYRPFTINYTGNSATGACTGTYASVKFDYGTADRPDIVPLYHAGSFIRSTKRLNKIQTYLGATQTNEYRLSFEVGPSSKSSRVISVTQCDAAATCLPAINFSPNNGTTGNFTKATTFNITDYYLQSGNGAVHMELGDFNGDGKMDILRWENDWTKNTLFLSNGDGSFTKATAFNITNEYLGNNNNAVGVALGDFNGDGKTDILRRWNDYWNNALFLSNGDGSFTKATTFNITDYYLQSGNNAVQMELGDFDGDGRTDILRFENDWTKNTLFLSNGDGSFTKATAFNITNEYLGNNNNAVGIALGDFNGDGKADILRRWNDYWNNALFLSNGDGSFTKATTFNITDYYLQSGNGAVRMALSDFNGDGKTDILRLENDWTKNTLFLSNGDGSFTKATTFNITNEDLGSNNNIVGIVLGDFNGDGKADILRRSDTYANNALFLSKGDGSFTKEPGFNITDQYLQAGNNAVGIALGDFNGDGKADILRRWDTYANNALFFATDISVPDVITTISSGLGTTVRTSYLPLTTSSVYTKGTGSVYPRIDLQMPMYVVSSVQSPNGIGSGYTTTNYQYGSLKAELGTGRGLLGFGWTQATQVETGIASRTDYRQDWPYTGLPSQTKKTLPSASGPSHQLNLVTNTYNCSDFTVGTNCTAGTSKHYFPYLKTSVEDSWDTNGTALPKVTTTNTFDCETTPAACYGNVASVSVSTGDGYSKTTSNTYKTADTANWILGRLVRTSVQSTVPDASIPSAPAAPAAGPTLTGISPTSGSAAGGTAITLTGTNFATGATVTIGSVPATGCTVVNSTSITCTTPAGTAGVKDVMVIVAGTSAALASGFTYMAAPTLTSISPNIGALAGGTGVTLTGTNFASGATVTIGGTAATSCSVVNSTTITCTTPAGTAGAKNVVVTETGGSATLSNGYTYQTVPSLSSISPTLGPLAGGTAVTLTGTGFGSGASVTIGGTAATGCAVVSSTSITCTTPSGSAGAKNVVVTQPGGSSTLTNGFTYQAAPSLTGISPTSGTTAGGTAVTLTGTNFGTGAAVTVGGASATGCTVVSSTSITCTTPAGTAGARNVVVTQTGGSTTLTNGYTYIVPNFIFNATIAASTTNYNLRAAAVAAGWNQTTPLVATVTVNAGVYVYSATTATPAFDTGTSFPAGSTVSIVNNGYLLGKGGDGGGSQIDIYGNPVFVGVGGNGGPALNLGIAATVNNQSGYIGGGGGGGGAGYANLYYATGFGGGGGAGGGAGGNVIYGGTSAGGGGGAAGATGGNGSTDLYGSHYSGGGGGRIIPGTGGAVSSSYGYGLGGGSGGGGSGWANYPGGSGAAAGASVEGYGFGGGGGGGWGAAGGAGFNWNGYAAVAGGAGGKAVALNGNSISWVNGTASSARAYGVVQ